jgi:hypothetical protein
MRSPVFDPEKIRAFLRAKKIATLPELKQALGTSTDLTVFRKLNELDYYSSYSHRGKYYTLTDIARFDDDGFWSYEGVHFSRFGSLVNSVEALVSSASAGAFASELQERVQVPVKEPLLKLISECRLYREIVTGLFLYCSIESARRKQQLLARRLLLAQPSWSGGAPHPEAISDEAKAGILLFFSLLDEQQRRLYAGLQSILLGPGGDILMAGLLELDPHTVAKGRHQLLEQDVQFDRTRRTGSGRKPVEKKRRR